MKLSNLYAGLSVLVPLGNSTPEGIYTGISYSFNFVNTPENTAFVKAHKDKYGVVPSDFTVNGYVGIKTLVEGIKKANTLDQEKVIDAMEGITVDTPGGPMTVRKFDHQAELGMFIGVTKKSPEFKDFLILEKLDYIPGSQTITPLEEVKALREKK
jgi:branched-chain amino acid transport system substrate-binding protein